MATELLPAPAPTPELAPVESERNEDEGQLLKSIVDKLQQEDSTVRDNYLSFFKKAEFYWRGIFDLAWDSVSRSWVSANGVLQTSRPQDQDYLDYDKGINVYRAHGESVIAAIASHVPNQVFFPKNAEDPDDLTAARANTQLSKLIALDNDVALRYIEIVQNMWNYGFAAVYNDFVEAKEYGEIERPVIQTENMEFKTTYCPVCDYTYEDAEPFVGACPMCGAPEAPYQDTDTEDVPVVADVLKEPDGREVIQVFSPIDVQIPYYVKFAKDIPYVILESEIHRSKAIGMFPEFRDKIPGGRGDSSSEYARQARLGNDALETSVVTFKRVWLAPWTYNVLDEDNANILSQKYPAGCFCVFIDDVFIGAMDEDMHDHWTFPESPTSRRIYSDPLGKPEMPIQDMIIELTDLTMETIEHGITQTFADPQVFDFAKYKGQRAVPGAVYPVKQAPPGRGLDTAFFQMKSATLSDEVKEFRQYLDYMGQFVVGDLPSIFGGAQRPGATLGEYQTSQNSAMQRLSITSRVASKLWSNVIRKAVIDLREKMKKDLHYVERLGNSFINIWIRKEQMTGDVGRVEPETSDQFPLTEAQRRDLLMTLIQANNPQLLQFFMHPENIGYAFRLLGFDELFIPGDRDRKKQLTEIQTMLNGQPTPVDQQYDDNVAHIQTTRAWLISDVGQATRGTNPQGYEMVVQHLLEHMQLDMMQKAAQQPPPEGDPNAPSPDAGPEPGPGPVEPPGPSGPAV